MLVFGLVLLLGGAIGYSANQDHCFLSLAERKIRRIKRGICLVWEFFGIFLAVSELIRYFAR